MDELLSDLEEADPADAPDIADAVAAELFRELDPDPTPEDPPAAPA